MVMSLTVNSSVPVDSMSCRRNWNRSPAAGRQTRPASRSRRARSREITRSGYEPGPESGQEQGGGADRAHEEGEQHEQGAAEPLRVPWRLLPPPPGGTTARGHQRLARGRRACAVQGSDQWAALYAACTSEGMRPRLETV